MQGSRNQASLSRVPPPMRMPGMLSGTLRLQHANSFPTQGLGLLKHSCTGNSP